MATRPRRALRFVSLEDRTVPAGQLDTTFSGDGIATAGLVTQVLTSEGARAMTVQPDGKVLLAGHLSRTGTNPDFAVYRYNTDGSLDASFGNGGKATADFGSPWDDAWGVAVQADGKVVLVGETRLPNDFLAFAVARFTAAGALDPTFSGDGLATVQVQAGSSSSASAVAIQPDGKIVVAGYTLGTDDFAAIRLNPDGSLDNAADADPLVTFDGDGIAVFGTPFATDAAHAVALQADGKIVVGGVTFSFNPDFGLARLNADGSVDTTFGTNGFIQDSYPFGGDERVRSLAIDPAGNIVAAGEVIPFFFGGSRDFALARYLPTGQPDTTFGTDYDLNGTPDGKLNTNFGGGVFGPDTSEEAHAVALQPDGKIVAAGSYSDGLSSDFAVARYLPNGALDPTFGRDWTGDNVPDGKQTVDFGSAEDEARGVAVVAGKIVLGGFTDNNQGDFAAARLDAAGQLDPTFDEDGRVSTNDGIVNLPNDDLGRAVVVQPDGKVIVGGRTGANGFGDFGLARFNRDGTLDLTFGDQGRVITEMSFFDDLRALVLQPDGKILAAGESNDGFALARYDADGNLDSSFDGDGRVITNMPSNGASGATAVAVQADGKIVAAGYVNSGANFGVARYLPNGRLDLTLDFDGRLTDPGSSGTPVGVAVQPNGRILVAGPNSVVRYLPDGRLDTSFDGDGRVQPNLGMNSGITGLALRADGRIVVAGHGALPPGPPQTDDFALTQLLANGSPDPTFAGGVFVLTDFGGRTDSATAVRLQGDGKVVLGGISRGAGNPQYALARYNLNGALDPTFDTDGKVTGTFGPGTDVAALFLQPNGKVDIAGSVDASGARDFAVAQFRGDNTLPTTTGIADFGVNEDAPARTFDLRALFDDAQDTDVELQFSVQNTNPGLVSATLDASDVLTLTFLPNKYGTATITVRATDLDGGFTDEAFTVTVASVNDLPVVMNDTANTTDQQPITVDVLANDSDADTGNPPPDTDVLTLVSVTGTTLGTAAIVNNQVRYTPQVNTDGDETLTYTVTDRFGATATGTLTIHVADVTKPAVKEVRLYYTANRYELLTDRIPVLAWSNVRKLQVVFSENVSVQSNDLTLTGVNVANYPFSGFNYNSATFTATWTLPAAIGIDRVRFTLDGTTASGVSDVTAGNLIGSNVVRQFAVLPGDLDGDGLVTQAEADTVKRNIGKRYPNPRNADLDGDGLVTQRDYAIARANVGKRV